MRRFISLTLAALLLVGYLPLKVSTARITVAGFSVPRNLSLNSSQVNNVVNAQAAPYSAVADSTGSGVGTDNASALQSAINAAANGVLSIPKAAKGYRVTSMISISHPVKIISDGAKIIFDFPARTPSNIGRLFNITASNVTIEGLQIDGTNATGTLTGGNRYALFFDGSGRTLQSPKVKNCRFTNLAAYSGTRPNTTNVVHGVYLAGTNNAVVEDNYFESLSGSAVRMENNTRASVRYNKINVARWGAIVAVFGNDGVEVNHNRIYGNTASDPLYWGAGVDIMSQAAADGGGSPNKNVTVADNEFSGTYKYAAVVRVMSTDGAIISRNTFEGCEVANVADLNSVSYPAQSNLLVIGVREATTSNGPPKNIVVSNNLFKARGAGQKAIYITGGAKEVKPIKDISIVGNEMVSVDSSNYFTAGVAVAGQVGGLDKLLVADNEINGNPLYDASVSPVRGLIGLAGSPTGAITNVTVTNNTLEYFNGAGGSGADIADSGVYIGEYADGVTVRGNRFRKLYHAIYIHPTALSALGGYNFRDNYHQSIVSDFILVAGRNPNSIKFYN